MRIYLNILKNEDFICRFYTKLNYYNIRVEEFI